MATEHDFYLDTERSVAELKAIVMASGAFRDADYKHLKGAISDSTNVTILDRYSPPHGPILPGGEAENGVAGRKCVGFRQRGGKDFMTFNSETFAAVVALLKAFPDDAYLTVYRGIPALLRKNGKLTLDKNLVDIDDVWGPSYPYRAMFDMPHTVEPLGPW